MAQNHTVWSFAPALYSFCLTSQQVWSKSLKQLSRKCPEIIQKGLKMYENSPFLGQFFAMKTTSRQKSDQTYLKENFPQIPNIKSDFRLHLPFSRYLAFFGPNLTFRDEYLEKEIFLTNGFRRLKDTIQGYIHCKNGKNRQQRFRDNLEKP